MKCRGALVIIYAIYKLSPQGLDCSQNTFHEYHIE